MFQYPSYRMNRDISNIRYPDHLLSIQRPRTYDERYTSIQPDFRIILKNLAIKIMELRDVAYAAYQPQIQLIIHVVISAIHSVETLEITGINEWLQVVSAIQIFNMSMSRLESMASMMDSRLQRICGSLASYKTFINSESFKNSPDYATRNSNMHIYLKALGSKLDSLKIEDRNFYTFLGPKASDKMSEIITLLTH